MARLLDSAEIDSALTELDGWSLDGGALAKGYTLGNFRAALEFMNKVGAVAEELNHHPDWSNSYNKVEIRLSTHSAGGVTALDVDLARRIRDIARGDQAV